jgi:hypothetical protein
MSDTENLPMIIFHAFEDLYFEEDKGKLFDKIFSKYIILVEHDHHMDLYDVLVLLSKNHRLQFDEMVKELRENALIND